MNKTEAINKFKAEEPEISAALLAEGKASVDVEAIAKDARAQGVTEGVVQGKTEGATAERARIKGVQDHSMPGHEKLINTLAFDGVTSPDAAAAQVGEAEKAARATTL